MVLEEVNRVSAHDELQRDGQFGVHCLAVLNRLMRRESRKVPSLKPPGGWSEPYFDDLVQDFFVGKGKGATIALYAQARDDDQFGALLSRIVKNWLIDRSRSETDLGALRFRLEKLLPARTEFARVPDRRPGAGRWRLADSPDRVFAGDVEDLAKAGRVVSVNTMQWHSDTRRAPVTDTPSLIRLLERIFETAGGSLELGQIVYAVRGRFHPQFTDDVALDHRTEPSERLAPGLGALETAQSGLDTQESKTRIALVARRLRNLLDDDALSILDVLDDPAQIAARLGVGRSQAYVTRRRVAGVLAELIGKDPDRAAILAETRSLAPGPPA